LLETEATIEIKHLISDLKPGEGDLLTALHRVQERFGYIPKDAIGVVTRQHVLEKRCPARVCKGHIRYEVVRESEDLQEAADICPTRAVIDVLVPVAERG